MIMKKNEIIEIVESVCKGRYDWGVSVFDDSYRVKEGRNKRLKFSGVYGSDKEIEELKKRLIGVVMICNEGKWNERRYEVKKIYRNKGVGEDFGRWWVDDSNCVCVVLRELKKLEVWEK